MNAPPLIYTDGDMIIPAYVFVDLRLTELLQSKSIAILAQSCDKNERAGRRELFDKLLYDSKREQFDSAYLSIKELERAAIILQSAQSEIERLFLRLKLLVCYLRACEALSQIRGCGVLADRVADHFSSIQKQHELENLRADIDTLKCLLKTISQFGIYENCIGGRHYFTKESNVQPLYDKIAEVGGKLKLSLPNHRSIRIRPDHSISTGICELFSHEYDRICAIFSKYDLMDLNEIIDYKDQFAFIFDILDICDRAAAVGCEFCIPSDSENREMKADRLSDITLLVKNCGRIIANDADFSGKDRFYFLVGANGGGKTTYLRAVGVNLILGLNGCPVFAGKMRLYPFKKVLTHFPADERFSGMGRLDEEQKRVKELLEFTSEDSFILFNETYSGTDEKRGFAMLNETAAEIGQRGAFGLFVTHFREVADGDIPLLHAVVDSEDENRRTFRIERRDGKTSSYARDILKKYKLDAASLSERRMRG